MPSSATSGALGGLADFRSFLLLEGEYRIDDTWHVAGLRGTGSKDIVVDGVFVPVHRTQSHTEYAVGAALPGQVLNDGPLYRMPWSVVFNMAVAASVFGAAQGFVDQWIVEARDRVVGRRVPLADDPLTQRRVAEAAWTLDVAMTMLHADAAELTRRAVAGDVPTMADRGSYRWHLNRSCEQVGIVAADLDPRRVRAHGVPGPSAAAPLPGHPGRAQPRLPHAGPGGEGGRRDAAGHDRA